LVAEWPSRLPLSPLTHRCLASFYFDPFLNSPRFDMSPIKAIIRLLFSCYTIVANVVLSLLWVVLVVGGGALAVGSVLILANPVYIFGLFDWLPSRTPPNTELASVSGFYGPGTYWAWVLCTISAVVSSKTDNNNTLPISADQVASFIYSISSMYGNGGRIARCQYPLQDNLIQDPSLQAASLVVNTAVLLYGFGAAFSTQRRKIPWVVFAVWSLLVLFFSPTVHPDTFLHLIYVETILLVYTPIGVGAILTQHAWKISPFLLVPFTLLEMIKARSLGIDPTFITPRTTSKITDMDQIAALLATIGVIVYQWKLWNVPYNIARRIRRRFQRNLVRSNSIELENRNEGTT
jgi:hypothetical protein